MADVVEWIHGHADFILIFLVFWCALHLARIERDIDKIRGMIAGWIDYENRRLYD